MCNVSKARNVEKEASKTVAVTDFPTTRILKNKAPILVKHDHIAGRNSKAMFRKMSTQTQPNNSPDKVSTDKRHHALVANLNLKKRSQIGVLSTVQTQYSSIDERDGDNAMRLDPQAMVDLKIANKFKTGVVDLNNSGSVDSNRRMSKRYIQPMDAEDTMDVNDHFSHNDLHSGINANEY